ncbi:MAG: SPOR domain-containing protein [Methylococcales bacterium]|nr:SPOR domain-containing protein [Methylococcales bacterium]
MANVQTKKTINIFQDDLDMMLDGIDLENYPENLIDEGDDLDRLLMDATFVKPVSKSERTNTNVDTALMVADMPRTGPKLVQVDAASEKMQAINALQDNNTEMRRQNSKGKFTAISEASNRAEHILDDAPILTNKTTKSFNDALEGDDDFDALDEFGWLDDEILSPVDSTARQVIKSDYLVDLKEDLDVEFNAAKDSFDDFDGFDDDMLITPSADHVAKKTDIQRKNQLETAAMIADFKDSDVATPSAGKSVTSDIQPETQFKADESLAFTMPEMIDDFDEFDDFDIGSDKVVATPLFEKTANNPMLSETQFKVNEPFSGAATVADFDDFDDFEVISNNIITAPVSEKAAADSRYAQPDTQLKSEQSLAPVVIDDFNDDVDVVSNAAVATPLFKKTPENHDDHVELDEPLALASPVTTDDFDDFDVFSDEAAVSPLFEKIHQDPDVNVELDKPLALASSVMADDFDDFDVFSDEMDNMPPLNEVTAELAVDDFTAQSNTADDTHDSLVHSASSFDSEQTIGRSSERDVELSSAVFDEDITPVSFDITRDDNDFEDAHFAAESVSKSPYVFEENIQTNGFSEIDDFMADIESADITLDLDATAPKGAVNADPDLMAHIDKLWNAHHLVQQQIDTITPLQNEANQIDKLAQLDQQSKERKERKEILDLIDNSSKKVPPLVYVAAGLSVLSLLVGGGLLALGSGTVSDVKTLKEQYVTVEEDLAVLKLGSSPATASATGGDVAAVAEQVKQIQAKLTTIDKTDQINALQMTVDSLKNELQNGAKKSAVEVAQVAAKPVQSLPTKPEKTLRAITSVAKEPTPSFIVSKKTEAPTLSSHWVANLVSFRQDWYANQKVAEFSRRGIAATIMPVDVKGETWYLLRSTGFSSQEDALNYAEKAKKTLNLTSVLVTQDK